MQDNYNVKILMIDDDDEILEDIKRWLKRFGYKDEMMKKALSPDDVEKDYPEQHFDVIIIDMRMEEVDDSGFKFIEKHKELSSIIIIFTANDNVIDSRKALRELKVWDYLPKGKNIDDINPFEVLHNSIQEGIRYKLKWGNNKDSKYINEHLDEFLEIYRGKSIAVMDGKVIEVAKTREELEKKMKDNDRPMILPIITEMPNDM